MAPRPIRRGGTWPHGHRKLPAGSRHQGGLDGRHARHPRLVGSAADGGRRSRPGSLFPKQQHDGPSRTAAPPPTAGVETRPSSAAPAAAPLQQPRSLSNSVPARTSLPARTATSKKKTTSTRRLAPPRAGGASTSTSFFWCFSGPFSSHPCATLHAARDLLYLVPMPVDADRCLQFDVVPDSRLQVPQHGRAARTGWCRRGLPVPFTRLHPASRGCEQGRGHGLHAHGSRSAGRHR